MASASTHRNHHGSLHAPVTARKPPTGAMVDQLDELLLVESWFRGRNGETALTADTVVGALEKLAVHLRERLPLSIGELP